MQIKLQFKKKKNPSSPEHQCGIRNRKTACRSSGRSIFNAGESSDGVSREREGTHWIHCVFGGRLRPSEGNNLPKATDPVKSWSRIIARYPPPPPPKSVLIVNR